VIPGLSISSGGCEALSCQGLETGVFGLRTWIWAVIENAGDEILDTVLLSGRANVLSCGYGRLLPRLFYLCPTQNDAYEVAVSGSSDVYPRALVKHGDGGGDVRPPSFGGRLEMISLLLRSHSHAQTLLIVIDAAEEAVSLLVDDGRPPCRPQA
jgi:hypothetical protein